MDDQSPKLLRSGKEKLTRDKLRTVICNPKTSEETRKEAIELATLQMEIVKKRQANRTPKQQETVSKPLS